MRLPIRLTAALAALLVCSMLPAVASAAPLTDVWGAGAIGVVDLESGKEPTYVVSLAFDKEMKEPPKEQVAVPIPTGAIVIWAGEVVSADPTDDITARDLDTLEIEGQTYAVFTVTKASRVQVECSVPSEVLTGDEKRSEVNLVWTAPSDMTAMQLSVLAPTGSRAEEVPEGVKAVPDQSGTAYVLNLTNMKKGEVAELQLALVPGMPELSGTDATATAGATESAETSGPVDGLGTGDIDSSVLPYLIGGLVVLILAAIGALLVVRRRETGDSE